MGPVLVEVELGLNYNDHCLIDREGNVVESEMKKRHTRYAAKVKPLSLVRVIDIISSKTMQGAQSFVFLVFSDSLRNKVKASRIPLHMGVVHHPMTTKRCLVLLSAILL